MNTAAWLAAARRRLDDLDSGRVEAIPGDQVFDRVRTRLEKLAKSAGRTPRAMLKFVLRDGFTETERVVQAVNAGRADVAAGRVRSHAKVMADADAALAGHVSSRKID